MTDGALDTPIEGIKRVELARELNVPVQDVGEIIYVPFLRLDRSERVVLRFFYGIDGWKVLNIDQIVEETGWAKRHVEESKRTGIERLRRLIQE